MIPNETMIEQLKEMYGLERVTKIIAQFTQAEGSIGAETYAGELCDHFLPSGWYLEVDEIGKPKQAFHLGIGEHSIGRSSDCTIVLNDRAVSRMHCMITVHADGRVVVCDLQSMNHVRVDGVILELDERREIHEGAFILASYNCLMILKRIAVDGA